MEVSIGCYKTTIEFYDDIRKYSYKMRYVYEVYAQIIVFTSFEVFIIRGWIQPEHNFNYLLKLKFVLI